MHFPRLSRGHDRVQVRNNRWAISPERLPLFFADLWSLAWHRTNWAHKQVMVAVTVRAVSNHNHALVVHRNRTPHQIFVWARQGNLFAPGAIPVILHEQLIAKLWRVIRLEVVRLFLERFLFGAAA